MQVDLDTLRGFFRSAPFMVDLGVEPTAVEPGRVSTQLVVAQRLCQHTGVVHAGVGAALADHTMGAAAQTMAADGHWVVPGPQAWVIKPGRQVLFTEAEVYAVQGGERRLVAKASGTMAVVFTGPNNARDPGLPPL